MVLAHLSGVIWVDCLIREGEGGREGGREGKITDSELESSKHLSTEFSASVGVILKIIIRFPYFSLFRWVAKT
jgi:hypothetical protein